MPDRWVAIGLSLGTFLAGAGGCISASLASTTGPLPPGGTWSTAPRQRVHLGETVRFDFLLVDWLSNPIDPLGIADYCVVFIDGERIETEPDARGHFRFQYTFDHRHSPNGLAAGDRLTVEATAYRQRARRDFMKVAGEWLTSESPYEIADSRVASASLTLEVYEAVIELTIDRPDFDLDPDSGVLRIRRRDGRVVSVYSDKPGRAGFLLTGPDVVGRYHVTYRPDGDELDPNGTTEVEFEVYDVSRTPHRTTTRIETP